MNPVDAERRAAQRGLRQGKWGFPVTKCPYAPSDRSPEAVAWRKGWTLGNAAFRQQTERQQP